LNLPLPEAISKAIFANLVMVSRARQELNNRWRIPSSSTPNRKEFPLNNEEKILKILETMQLTMDTMQSQIGSMDSRLGGVESRLGGVESRLGSVESKINTMQVDIKGLQSDVREIKRDLKGAWDDILRLDKRLTVHDEELAMLKRLK
jgi:chromosome segregation ATPase